MQNKNPLDEWAKQKRQRYAVRLVIFAILVGFFVLTSAKHITRSLIVVTIFLIIYVLLLSLARIATQKSRQAETASVAKGNPPYYRARLTADSLQALNISLPDSTNSSNRTIAKFGIPGRLSVGSHQMSFIPDNKIRGIDFSEPLNFDYDFFLAFKLSKLWAQLTPSVSLGLSNKND